MYLLQAKITHHLGYDEGVPRFWRHPFLLVIFSSALASQNLSAPAGIRPPLRKNGSAILPGGRIIAPLGEQYPTGSGPFGLSIGFGGHTVVTSNTGPGPNSFTVLEPDHRTGRWSAQTMTANSYDSDQEFGRDWRGLFMGLAYATDHSVWASEGNSG